MELSISKTDVVGRRFGLWACGALNVSKEGRRFYNALVSGKVRSQRKKMSLVLGMGAGEIGGFRGY